MNELMPPSYGLFAHEAGKIELENPDIANHDIKSAITSIQNGSADIFEYLSDEEFDQLYRDLMIDLDSSGEEISHVIAGKIESIQTIVEEVQKRDEKLVVPSQVRFALNPEHHEFLYHLHNLWKNPNNLHTIESLRRCRVDLPLLLEAFGVQGDDSCANVVVSGVIAGMALSSARNAVKYAAKETIPVARLIENQNGGNSTLSIYNESAIAHSLPNEPYPHLRPISLGERGQATSSSVPGTGTGAWAMKVLGLLHGAEYQMWEMAPETDEGLFLYQTTIVFPPFARYMN